MSFFKNLSNKVKRRIYVSSFLTFGLFIALTYQQCAVPSASNGDMSSLEERSPFEVNKMIVNADLPLSEEASGPSSTFATSTSTSAAPTTSSTIPLVVLIDENMRSTNSCGTKSSLHSLIPNTPSASDLLAMKLKLGVYTFNYPTTNLGTLQGEIQSDTCVIGISNLQGMRSLGQLNDDLLDFVQQILPLASSARTDRSKALGLDQIEVSDFILNESNLANPTTGSKRVKVAILSSGIDSHSILSPIPTTRSARILPGIGLMEGGASVFDDTFLGTGIASVLAGIDSRSLRIGTGLIEILPVRLYGRNQVLGDDSTLIGFNKILDNYQNKVNQTRNALISNMRNLTVPNDRIEFVVSELAKADLSIANAKNLLSGGLSRSTRYTGLANSWNLYRTQLQAMNTYFSSRGIEVQTGYQKVIAALDQASAAGINGAEKSFDEIQKAHINLIDSLTKRIWSNTLVNFDSQIAVINTEIQTVLTAYNSLVATRRLFQTTTEAQRNTTLQELENVRLRVQTVYDQVLGMANTYNLDQTILIQLLTFTEETKQELLIALTPTTKNINNRDVVRGILRSVNSGADIVHLAISGITTGCDPILGEIIYRSLRNNVSFVMPAGDDQVSLVALNPSNIYTQKTVSPACWGPFFKGAISVGSVDDRVARKVPTALANQGSSIIEIGASGFAVPVVAPSRKVMVGHGSQLAAPQVTAGLALVQAYHKNRDWTQYSPWVLEDILLAGTPQLNELNSQIKDGRVLDFSKLVAQLKTYGLMTPEARTSFTLPGDTLSAGFQTAALPVRPVDQLQLTVDDSFIRNNQRTIVRAYIQKANTTIRQEITSRVTWSTNNALAKVETGGRLVFTGAASARVVISATDALSGLAAQTAVQVSAPPAPIKDFEGVITEVYNQATNLNIANGFSINTGAGLPPILNVINESGKFVISNFMETSMTDQKNWLSADDVSISAVDLEQGSTPITLPVNIGPSSGQVTVSFSFPGLESGTKAYEVWITLKGITKKIQVKKINLSSKELNRTILAGFSKPYSTSDTGQLVNFGIELSYYINGRTFKTSYYNGKRPSESICKAPNIVCKFWHYETPVGLQDSYRVIKDKGATPFFRYEIKDTATGEIWSNTIDKSFVPDSAPTVFVPKTQAVIECNWIQYIYIACIPVDFERLYDERDPSKLPSPNYNVEFSEFTKTKGSLKTALDSSGFQVELSQMNISIQPNFNIIRARIPNQKLKDSPLLLSYVKVFKIKSLPTWFRSLSREGVERLSFKYRILSESLQGVKGDLGDRPTIAIPVSLFGDNYREGSIGTKLATDTYEIPTPMLPNPDCNKLDNNQATGSLIGGLVLLCNVAQLRNLPNLQYAFLGRSLDLTNEAGIEPTKFSNIDGKQYSISGYSYTSPSFNFSMRLNNIVFSDYFIEAKDIYVFLSNSRLISSGLTMSTLKVNTNLRFQKGRYSTVENVRIVSQNPLGNTFNFDLPVSFIHEQLFPSKLTITGGPKTDISGTTNAKNVILKSESAYSDYDRVLLQTTQATSVEHSMALLEELTLLNNSPAVATLQMNELPQQLTIQNINAIASTTAFFYPGLHGSSIRGNGTVSTERIRTVELNGFLGYEDQRDLIFPNEGSFVSHEDSINIVGEWPAWAKSKVKVISTASTTSAPVRALATREKANTLPWDILNWRVSGDDLVGYTFKIINKKFDSCSKSTGYSGPIFIEQIITAGMVKESPGSYSLCLLGINKSGKIQSVSSATEIPFAHEIPNPTVSVVTPTEMVNSFQTNLTVQGNSYAKEYSYKVGPSSVTNCIDSAGYSSFLSISTSIPIDMKLNSNGSYTICLKGKDPLSGRIQTVPFSASWMINRILPTATLNGLPRALFVGDVGERVSVTVGGLGVTAYKYAFTASDCAASLAASSESPILQPIVLQANAAMGISAQVCVIGRDTAGNWQTIEKATIATVALERTCSLTMNDGSVRVIRPGGSTTTYRIGSARNIGSLECQPQTRTCNGTTGVLSGFGNFTSCTLVSPYHMPLARTHWTAPPLSSSERIDDMGLADFNGDGRSDLFLIRTGPIWFGSTEYSTKAVVYQNYGSNFDFSGLQYGSGSPFTFSSRNSKGFGDANGDKKVDQWSISKTNFSVNLGGLRSFTSWVPQSVGTWPTSEIDSVPVAGAPGNLWPEKDVYATGVGDLNGDRVPDVWFVRGGLSGLSAHLGLASGGFAPYSQWTTTQLKDLAIYVSPSPKVSSPSSFVGPAFGVDDLNNDGRSDFWSLVPTGSAREQLNIQVSVSGGTRMFPPVSWGTIRHLNQPSYSEKMKVWMKDINRDGRMDLILSDLSNNPNEIYVMYGQGGKFEAPRLLGVTNRGTTSIFKEGFDDLTGDGTVDYWNFDKVRFYLQPIVFRPL